MSENLFIQGNKKNPTINCDSETGKISIRGVSVPEDIYEVYEPFKNWLDNYVKTPKEETVFTIALEYFNTSTARYMLDTFKRVKEFEALGISNVRIIWEYEADDEDMQEAGEHYKALLGGVFELKPVNKFA